MKNIRKYETKNLLSGMLFGLMVVMLMFSAVGCSKKKSGPNYNQGWWRPGMPGMPGNPGAYGYGPMGMGLDMDGNEVYLEFGLPQQIAMGMDPYFYSGQVYVTGGLNMNGLTCLNGGAYIPAGQYQIYSNQPAMANNGIVSGALLVAQGNGVMAQIYLSWAIIQSPAGGVGGMDNIQPLTAMMTVQSVNGIPCNATLAVSPDGF